MKAAKNSVLLVDNSPLRRAALHSFLLGWLINSETEVLDFDVPDASDHLEVDDGQQLILLSVGGSSLEDTQNKQSVRMLRGVAPDTPLAIIGEREDADETLAALRLGAAAYLPTSLDTDFAVHCLNFLRHGGSYFPPTALQAAVERYSGDSGGSGEPARTPAPKSDANRAAGPVKRRPKQETAPTTFDVHAQRLRDAPEGPMNAARSDLNIPCQRQKTDRIPVWRASENSLPERPCAARKDELRDALEDEFDDIAEEEEALEIEPAPCSLTPAESKLKHEISTLTNRQQEVLRLLIKGAANKQIARKLSMTESTVKVHVHQIIKKFGVNNRTEVVAKLYQAAPTAELIS
ncbi:MAG: LuxR C-terminal-related transcriptional regulator [Pseudomonadota bacterium]